MAIGLMDRDYIYIVLGIDIMQCPLRASSDLKRVVKDTTFERKGRECV
jgi:hypothetical protein